MSVFAIDIIENFKYAFGLITFKGCSVIFLQQDVIAFNYIAFNNLFDVWIFEESYSR